MKRLRDLENDRKWESTRERESATKSEVWKKQAEENIKEVIQIKINEIYTIERDRAGEKEISP